MRDKRYIITNYASLVTGTGTLQHAEEGYVHITTAHTNIALTLPGLLGCATICGGMLRDRAEGRPTQSPLLDARIHLNKENGEGSCTDNRATLWS